MADSDLILRKWHEIQADLEKNEKLMPFVCLLQDEFLDKKCNALKHFQIIVSASLQTGNYIRAIKYMVLIDKTNKQISEMKNKIIEKITDFVL